MPELPEVETIRLFLQKNIIGKTITDLRILSPKSFSGDTDKIIGQKIIRLTRIGKQLSLHLSNKLILLVHLKMTGQLIYQCHPELVSGSNLKHTHLVFTFSDHSNLCFNDLRRFGWIRLLTRKEVNAHQLTLGIDILSPRFTLNYFKNVLKKSKKSIKTLLHDQSFFAGIGNIYANDALFLAKIHPLTPANHIRANQSNNLWKSIIFVIKEGIVHGGSTAKDKGYLRPDGSEGEHQNHFHVYQHENQLCPICNSRIIRLKLSGRGTFLCPQCQIL